MGSDSASADPRHRSMDIRMARIGRAIIWVALGARIAASILVPVFILQWVLESISK